MEEGDIMWLKDLLPHRLKNPHIMTYDYTVEMGQDSIASCLENIALELLNQLSTKRKEEKVTKFGNNDSYKTIRWLIREV